MDGISEIQIEELLDAIELAEYPLLRWGITNSSFTDSELKSLISKVAIGKDVELLKNALLVRGLVFETPYGTYRSRIAELIRLTLRLRQWFPEKKSDSGKLLIHDVKYHLRPRSFPKRDVISNSVIESLVANGLCSDFDIAQAIFPERISKFQERAITEVSESLNSDRDESFVVASGTGSGKTNAYFIPLFNWLSEEVKRVGQLGVRSIALYPRNELLKDQLSNALGLTQRLNVELKKKSLPMIRLGIWFGDTPWDLGAIKSGQNKNWLKTKVEGKNAFTCPFLRCHVCTDAKDLVLLEDDIQRRVSTLRCQNRTCDFKVTSEELVYERRALSVANGGCEVLFTTTESLNRQMSTAYGDSAFGLSASSKLKSVLVDEAHIYDGLTGAQNAYLFRRLRHRVSRPLTWVSLSATLDNPSVFINDLIGLITSVIEPESTELELRGSDYVMAVRHYLESKSSPLSSAIQLAMLMTRSLDPLNQETKSGGLFGSKLFIFGDKHDVVNRFYASLSDAEGSPIKGRNHRPRSPKSLATLRSENQSGLSDDFRESGISRYDDGQWWKLSEDLGHAFGMQSGKKVGITSSQQRGINKDADIVVATGSLEVGYDDISVGAVLQYKVPKSSASFLQRKGRAGRTQAMRPITAMVLSPFGSDRTAWTNAENQIFLPRLPERRLPLGNRYTQKMQATYALLDWLHYSAGSSNSWALLSGKSFDRKYLGNSMSSLSKLLEDVEYQREFANYVSKCLDIREIETEQVLWSQPRGILSVVVPTILRRLENSFTEDGADDKSPLKEFVSADLFSELNSQDVEVVFPGEAEEKQFLPIDRSLREFSPGNVSRHFRERYWLPVGSDQATIDVSQIYGVMDSGYSFRINDEDVPFYRPTLLKLAATPEGINDSTTTYGNWGKSFHCVGNSLPISTGITVWDKQKVLINSYLHSRGSNVLVYRYIDKTEGWISKRIGNPERVDSSFVVGDKKVVIGFDLTVDGLKIELNKPTEYPGISNRERTEWLEYILKRNTDLMAVANVFDLERIARGLILMRLKYDALGQILELSDFDFMQELTESTKVVQLDLNLETSENEFHWLTPVEIVTIRKLFAQVHDARNHEWETWLDNRIMTSLAGLILESFRMMIPEIDFDDLIIDVTSSQNDDSLIAVWICETSVGGNGSIERIVDELQNGLQFEFFVQSLLKPQEFEKLDSELRSLIQFAKHEGSSYADEIRESWSQGLAKVENSITKFFNAVEDKHMFPTNSARSVFVNRFLGPGCQPDLMDFGFQISSQWDVDEDRIGFSISPEIAGLIWKDNAQFDHALHLEQPTPARRAAAVTGLAWTRKEQGVEMDFEISNPFNFNSSFDFTAFRKMVTVDIEADRQLVEHEDRNPNYNGVEEIRFSGSPEEVRREIIAAILDPVEDDAIWVYRRIFEVTPDDRGISASMRADYVSL
jgi:hypothetical protein